MKRKQVIPPTLRRLERAAMAEYAAVKKYARTELAKALRCDGSSVFTPQLDSFYRACAEHAAAKRKRK